MNPLDTYLARVARELCSMPAAKRDDELRELRSHLEQRSEDFARSGLSSQDAQAKAIHEFGSPRVLGIKLCDAWEAEPLSAMRLLSAVGRVTLFWFCATIELMTGIHAQRIWPQSVLFPMLPSLLSIIAVCIPLGCGWLWFSCVGKSRQLVPLLFLVLAFALLSSGACLAHLNARLYLTDEPLYDSILVLNPLLAIVGVSLANALHQRRGHFALASGHVLPTIASRRSHWNPKRICLGVTIVVGAGLWRYVGATLNPSDPVGALRASLLVRHNPSFSDLYPIETPQIMKMRELPPTTPAEKAGTEKRVSFQIEVHADEDHARFYIDQLKGRLPLRHKHTPEVENRIRQSIATLQRNSHTVEGIARLVHTPDGWQVDEHSFNRSKLWTWFYIAVTPSESNPSIPQYSEQ